MRRLASRLQTRRGRVLAVVATAVIALSVLAATDFARFVLTLESHTPAAVDRADGIVVLTGGAERIPQAFDLLAQGRARRMLITGVNQATRPQDLAPAPNGQQAGQQNGHEVGRDLGRDLVTCCVDLDRNALNTLGNALETARWARQNRFDSLIVVTASYHMPRTLLEIRRALPDVRLIAYPVVPDGLKLRSWWCDLGTARLLAFEYAKYAVASLRLRLDRPTAHRVKPAVPLETAGRFPNPPLGLEGIRPPLA